MIQTLNHQLDNPRISLEACESLALETCRFYFQSIEKAFNVAPLSLCTALLTMKNDIFDAKPSENIALELLQLYTELSNTFITQKRLDDFGETMRKIKEYKLLYLEALEKLCEPPPANGHDNTSKH